MRFAAAVTLVLVAGLPVTGRAEPTAAEFLLGMEDAYAKVTAYTAQFSRQEKIDERLRAREEAVLKFQRPGKLYLRWQAGSPAGREILYVPGANGDRLLVHEPGMFSGRFTLLLAPDSPRVLAESRHPVTDIGIGKLVERIVAEVRRGLGNRELRVADAGATQDGARRIRRVAVIPEPTAIDRYYAPRTVVEVDTTLGLPVGLIALDAADQVIERYEYRDVRIGAVLGALDFDPANPEYDFPRWRMPL
jgi:outer membrane lipoprotein-sorting protein